MAADTGPIGGDLSHEFVILAETGESQIYADKNIFEVNLNKYEFNDQSLQRMRDDFTKIYSATDEKFNKDEFNKMVKKEKIKLLLKESRLVIFFILEISILSQ